MSQANSSDNELNQRIAALKDLNKSLDDYEDLFSYLTKAENKDFEQLNELISPQERGVLNWNLGYSVYTNYYRKYSQ